MAGQLKEILVPVLGLNTATNNLRMAGILLGKLLKVAEGDDRVQLQAQLVEWRNTALALEALIRTQNERHARIDFPIESSSGTLAGLKDQIVVAAKNLDGALAPSDIRNCSAELSRSVSALIAYEVKEGGNGSPSDRPSSIGPNG